MKSGGLSSLNRAGNRLQDLFDKLSSGKRINKAKDDAAGLAIASQLSAGVAQDRVSINNINDAFSFIQAADQALSGAGDALNRINELALQASNGTLSDEQRSILQTEVNELTAQIQQQGNIEFNGRSVSEDVSIQGDGELTVEGVDTSVLASLEGLDISSQAAAQSSLETISNVRSEISSARGDLGASEARLESQSNTLATSIENQEAARSRIEDADTAQLVADKTATEIRQRASIAVEAQANISRGIAIKLLS